VSGPGRTAPPGWPADVPAPDAPGWDRRATGWLFDQCPGELRGYDVLQRHPVLLAYVAVGQVDAALAAVRGSLARARADLRDDAPPEAVGELLDALQREEARLVSAARAVRLVAEALRGVRHRPRL
jgi:hypothetical protein